MNFNWCFYSKVSNIDEIPSHMNIGIARTIYEIISRWKSIITLISDVINTSTMRIKNQTFDKFYIVIEKLYSYVSTKIQQEISKLQEGCCFSL